MATKSSKKPVAKKRVTRRSVNPKKPTAPPATVLQATDVPAVGKPWAGQGGIRIGEVLGESGKPNYHLVQLMNDDGTPVTVEGAWGNYGKDLNRTTSFRDGLANTEAMLAAGSDIAKKVRAFGNDCYLPAQGELNLIRLNNPKAPTSGWFWSSTQASANGAWCQGFGSGLTSWGSKDDELRAFVVRRVLIK